jgi:YfiH family protein
MMSMPIEMITMIRNFSPAPGSTGAGEMVCASSSARNWKRRASLTASRRAPEGCSPIPRGALNLAGFNEDDAANIHENRRRFLKLFPGRWRLATCWQIHGADVRRVDGGGNTEAALDGNEERCDALTTDAPHILVGIQTADCVPILLGDARSGACAAVHAGWRGTAAEIVAPRSRGCASSTARAPRDVCASLGPAALGCCYEVGSDVIEIFRARFPYADELLIPTGEGTRPHRLAHGQPPPTVDAGSRPRASTPRPFAPSAAPTSSSPIAATKNSTAAPGGCSPSSEETMNALQR